jgi:hypothetical protein
VIRETAIVCRSNGDRGERTSCRERGWLRHDDVRIADKSGSVLIDRQLLGFIGGCRGLMAKLVSLSEKARSRGIR